MKGGLLEVPGHKSLEKAYNVLLHQKPKAPTCSDLALFSQWTRFDPRLGEIWVRFVSDHWRKIQPLDLHDELIKLPWPGAAAVLLEFSRRALAPSKKESHLFRLWQQLVTNSFQKANGEQFFIGQRRLGGKAMFEDARFSLTEYRRWGYLSREILFNKQQLPKGNSHSIDPATREELLKELLETTVQITTLAYWNALGKSISRRQAERDLKGNPHLRSFGNTKARYYVRRHSPRNQSLFPA